MRPIDVDRGAAAHRAAVERSEARANDRRRHDRVGVHEDQDVPGGRARAGVADARDVTVFAVDYAGAV